MLPRKILFIDHYDSFSFNLVDWLKVGAEPLEVVHVFNDQLEEIDVQKFDAFVISPGPGRPRDYPNTIKLVEKYMGNRPILGVCLGMQIIGLVMGGELEKRRHPHHGNSVEVFWKDTSQVTEVATYNSLILNSNLEYQEGIKVLAELKYESHSEIFAISSPELTFGECSKFTSLKKAPWLGFQFHPESFITKNPSLYSKFWWDIVEAWYFSQVREHSSYSKAIEPLFIPS